MADTVGTKDLLDSDRHHIVFLRNESDGTGEAAVKKIDVSALGGAPSTVAITQIWYSTQGMAVELHWDATTDTLAWCIPADECGHIDFRDMGGLVNDSGSGKTGDIMVTTVGHGAGDGYAIAIQVKKD